MTAAHLHGLPTSTVLRESAVVLEQGGTPTGFVYAAQLRARADLLCEAVGRLELLEVNNPAAADVLYSIRNVLRGIGEIRGQ